MSFASSSSFMLGAAHETTVLVSKGFSDDKALKHLRSRGVKLCIRSEPNPFIPAAEFDSQSEDRLDSIKGLVYSGDMDDSYQVFVVQGPHALRYASEVASSPNYPLIVYASRSDGDAYRDIYLWFKSFFTHSLDLDDFVELRNAVNRIFPDPTSPLPPPAPAPKPVDILHSFPLPPSTVTLARSGRARRPRTLRIVSPASATKPKVAPLELSTHSIHAATTKRFNNAKPLFINLPAMESTATFVGSWSSTTGSESGSIYHSSNSSNSSYDTSRAGSIDSGSGHSRCSSYSSFEVEVEVNLEDDGGPVGSTLDVSFHSKGAALFSKLDPLDTKLDHIVATSYSGKSARRVRMYGNKLSTDFDTISSACGTSAVEPAFAGSVVGVSL